MNNKKNKINKLIIKTMKYWIKVTNSMHKIQKKILKKK